MTHQDDELISKGRAVTTQASEGAGWLIECKDLDHGRPVWYVEDATGWHGWTPDANTAKRFPSREAVEQFPPYRMIATDPNVTITEHVFMLAIDPNRPNAFITVPDPLSLSDAAPQSKRVERLEALVEELKREIGSWEMQGADEQTTIVADFIDKFLGDRS